MSNAVQPIQSPDAMLDAGDRPTSSRHGVRRTILVVAVLPAAMLLVLWLNRRSCAPALAGFLAFVAGLLPVLGLVKFNFQYYSTVADRGGSAQRALIFARLNVDLAPEVVPYTNLGAALAQVGDWQGALQALRHAVSLDPANYNAQCDLASVLYHFGDRSGAIAHYQVAESIDPDDPRAADALKELGAEPSPSSGHQP
jgi:tetratricopeptide (TPR) repeat protein